MASSSESEAGGRALAALAAGIRSCRICVEQPRRAPLPHAPRPVLRVSPTARLAIAGQAPGTRVHASGIPFSDPSGLRLRAWMGVTDAEFYDERRIAIIPMGFCFPGLDRNGGDLPPRPECAPAWRPRLMAALPQIELVLAVGQYAQGWHLGRPRRPVTEIIRGFADALATGASMAPPGASSGVPRILPLPHPSWRNTGWLKANPWFETEVLPYLRLEVRKLMGD